ncbi:hypothetical protein TELCIR_19379, partial [Teladorsagia circumcincta]
RVCDAFHLQLVSGLSRFTYWFTGYLFDMSIYILSVVAILMIYVMFGVKEFAYSFESLCCFFLVFLLYGSVHAQKGKELNPPRSRVITADSISPSVVFNGHALCLSDSSHSDRGTGALHSGTGAFRIFK